MNPGPNRSVQWERVRFCLLLLSYILYHFLVIHLVYVTFHDCRVQEFLVLLFQAIVDLRIVLMLIELHTMLRMLLLMMILMTMTMMTRIIFRKDYPVLYRGGSACWDSLP